MLPVGAVLEAMLSEHAVLYDVSHILPRGATPYRVRDPSQIRFIVIHKSGADGPAGYAGAVASARYQIREKRDGGRGWPGMAYTYWLPREPDRDELGRIVAYRCNPDTARSYHTGGVMNGLGVGIGVQGNYDGDWDLVGGVPNVERAPTDAQMELLDGLVTHLTLQHGIVLGLDPAKPDDDDYGLTGHWEHGKAVCPGDALRQWVCARRLSPPPHPVAPAMMDLAISTGELNPARFDYAQRNRALELLGYYSGADQTCWDVDSRGALEAFQRANGLSDDGWWGPATATRVAFALREKNLLDEEAFYLEGRHA